MLGFMGLKLLEQLRLGNHELEASTPKDAIATLLAEDEDRHHRQLHLHLLSVAH